jgi:formylglycine-generating enzyme required for sulfatase activity
MGSPDTAAIAGAAPVHTVTVSSYYIDTTEVAQNDYLSLMGVNPSEFSSDLRQPVERVTWFDALLFCNARSKRDDLDTIYSYTSVSGTAGNGCSGLGDIAMDYTKNGYRLPTEAEWEYACRAGTATEYYWGTEIDSSYCWYYSNSGNTTHQVALKLPNARGLYDMSGNVLEWCNDWYDRYSALPQSDPVGPSVPQTFRILRGGSWQSYHQYAIFSLASAYRLWDCPEDILCTFGIRCVRR